MKKTILKVTAAAVLVGQLLTLGGAFQDHKAEAAASSTTTAAPVMRDNLAKFGLKKAVELPVTVTAGGLSYTLEKIMIYDFNSKEALALRKTYKYGDQSGLIAKPKYFVWTKITVKNNSKKIFDSSTVDPWVLYFKDSKSLDPVSNFSRIGKVNDKSAVNQILLKPGEQLSTYQALMYASEFDHFVIRLFFNGGFAEKFVVERPI